MLSRTIAARTHGRYLVVPASPAAGVLVAFHGYAEGAEAALARASGIPGAERWTLVAVQGLHRFYRRRSSDVVASWMTSQDRELAIADNVGYTASVLDAVMEEWPTDGPIVFAAFSQGVAMAYRAACRSGRRTAGVISLGGDVPPELDRAALSQIAEALVGRGSRDDWYSADRMAGDVARLREAGVALTEATLDAGHEWTAEFSAAAAAFLSRVRR